MSNIDYKKNYEEVVFEKIIIKKEYEQYKSTINYYYNCYY